MHRPARARIGLVPAVALLILAACASKTTPRSALGGLGGSATPGVSGGPTLAPTPTLSGRPGATATATATRGGNHGTPTATHSTPSQPSTSTPPLTGVSVHMKSEPSIFIPNCPYVYTMTATITVQQPIDLTYLFEHDGYGLQQPVPIHFDAAGSQTVTYPDYPVSPADLTFLTDSILVKGPGGGEVVANASYTAQCISTAGPVVVNPAKAICPYTATFSVKVSVKVGPNTSNYRWIFGDGSEATGTLTFTSEDPSSQVVSIKRIVQQGSPVSVVFVPNEGSIGTAPVKATCLA